MPERLRLAISERMKGNQHTKGRKQLPEEIEKRKISLMLKGYKHSEATRKIMSEARLGKSPWNKGKKNVYSKETLEKMRLDKLGKKYSLETIFKMKLSHEGEKNHKWISDRNLLKDDSKERGGQLHREWSKNVKKRDNWKCKINNPDCFGKIVAHHILSWKDYLELRYELNNGITLCKFHHPLKKIEEQRLSPYLKELIS